MGGLMHNGTPPYTFHYARYGGRYTEQHDTLEEAVRSWSGGEDEGEIYGIDIADASGAIVVTHDEWKNGLWSACDDNTIGIILANPDWRRNIAAEMQMKIAEATTRKQERLERQVHQYQQWQQWILEESRAVGVIASLSVLWESEYVDWSDNISPYKSRMPAIEKPSVETACDSLPLHAETTREEIRTFLQESRLRNKYLTM